MLTRHFFLGLSAAFVSVLLGATTALAQKRAPAQLLAAYVQEREIPRGQSRGLSELVQAVTNAPGDYPAADLESLLRGLEDVALTGTPSRFRAEAASLLTYPSSTRAVHPLRGRFRRLATVYSESTDPLVRIVLLRQMGDQIDRGEAAAFLESVASHSELEAEARSAIDALSGLGEEGRTVLKRLYDTNAFRNRESKAMLEVLAKYDFRRPSSAR